jgi:hypothetical protein
MTLLQKRHIACVTAFVAMFFVPAILCADDAKRSADPVAVPPKSELIAAGKKIDDLFKTDLANHNTAARKSLALKFLQLGTETTNDMAAKYALIDKARLVALETGDVDLAIQAMLELETDFLVESNVLETETLRKAAQANPGPDGQEMIAEFGISALQKMLEQEQYDESVQLQSIVKSAAAGATDSLLKARAAAWVALAQLITVEHKHLKSAYAALAVDPNDPAANFAVGKFECLYRQDWPKGLRKLLRANPTGASGQWVALAKVEDK